MTPHARLQRAQGDLPFARETGHRRRAGAHEVDLRVGPLREYSERSALLAGCLPRLLAVAGPVGALTKAQMADRLFDELGLNKREAKEIVELFFNEIRDSLERNEQVKLSGFGNFDLREKGERPGRNPKTGEEIPISARRVVTFRPGQKLKARVEAYAGRESE